MTTSSSSPKSSALMRSQTVIGSQSLPARPEDLRVRAWYEEPSQDSPVSTIEPLGNDPLNQDGSNTSSGTNNNNHHNLDHRGGGNNNEAASSTRTSSMESEHHPHSQQQQHHHQHHQYVYQRPPSVPRKACMDLQDAIALLDETCPNPDVSPVMTPRTPRTPLTPHSRSKRARSKSSDNSSNYSSERLNDKSSGNAETPRERIRPFLKKIGISMTEDRPLLAKIAPRILGGGGGKPYLEKIGHSRAVDKSFVEETNTGSSGTLDKFTFDAATPSGSKSSKAAAAAAAKEELERKMARERRDEIRGFSTGERRKSGKNFLLKMYSFETEDLVEADSKAAPRRDPLRGASLDDVLESGCESTTSPVASRDAAAAAPELVRCRVTTSEEIILQLSSSSRASLNSPMEIASWGASPKRRAGANTPYSPSKRAATTTTTTTGAATTTPERVVAVYKDLDEPRQPKAKTCATSSAEGTLERRKSRMDRWGGASSSFDNWSGVRSSSCARERVATPVFAEIGVRSTSNEANNSKGSCSSVFSSSSITRQDQFTESYADYKLRTQQGQHALRRLMMSHQARRSNMPPSFDMGFSSREAALEKRTSEDSPKIRSKSVETDRLKDDRKERQPVDNGVGSNSSSSSRQQTRTKSVLRKQKRVEKANYEPDNGKKLENDDDDPQEQPGKRKLVHEPSQETLNLLQELQKVKSSLKSPGSLDEKSIDDASGANDPTTEPPLKAFPKRVLLTDQEFCLSIERENSVRRPAPKREEANAPSSSSSSSFFEKRCLSLDYADDDKSSTSTNERRAKRSEELLLPEETSSDVFETPTEDETSRKTTTTTTTATPTTVPAKAKHKKDRAPDPPKDQLLLLPKPPSNNNNNNNNSNNSSNNRRQQRHSDSDAITATNNGNGNNQLSPKRRNQSESTSPKATAFRVKKRLDRVSVEDKDKTLKQEQSFAADVNVDKEQQQQQQQTTTMTTMTMTTTTTTTTTTSTNVATGAAAAAAAAANVVVVGGQKRAKCLPL
ncbi:hypothetical protein TKK_0010613 [Trichogramma kaykai]